MYSDTITKKAAIDIIKQLPRWILNADGEFELADATTIAMIDPGDAIAAILTAPPASQWIPCSERPPEEGVSVLISVGGMYSAEGCLRWDKDWNQFRWSAIQDKEVVDAWMPLPEPYKEKQVDDEK